MAKIAINLYSVRALDASLEEVLELTAAAGYDGIQFSGKYTPLDGDPSEIASILDRLGLEATPPHASFEAIEAFDSSVIDTYQTLGNDGLVIPYLEEDHFASEQAIDSIASQLDAIDRRLEEELGWRLHYHNHAHEYVAFGDTTGFERFIDKTNINIELDVGWAHVGGDDPVTRIQQLEGRSPLIHLKDMHDGPEPTFAELGHGDVDIEGCVRSALETGSEWLIYEHDDPRDPRASIEHGAAHLTELVEQFE